MPVAFGSAARRRIVAGALFMCAVLDWPRTAGAATTSYEVGDQAVVQVISRTATVRIRTWNRATVHVEWSDGASVSLSKATQETRSSYLIPTVSVQEAVSPDGSVLATLLPEDFPVPKLSPGLHDVVRVVENNGPPEAGKPRTVLTLIVPESAGLVNVRSGRGAVRLSDYHGTTIVAVGRGGVVFENVSGDAFVQPLNGHFYAIGSTFDRLRIRSNRADEIFDDCRVRQIEATTLTGNIMFDNGIFDAGLARFETDRGLIGLGVNGGAQVEVHTQDGHVLTILPAATLPPAFAPADGDRVHLVGNGGPLVNAASNHGDVFLYEGSIADQPPATLVAAWRPLYDMFVTNREVARRNAAALRSQPPRQPTLRQPALLQPPLRQPQLHQPQLRQPPLHQPRSRFHPAIPTSRPRSK